MTQRVVGWNIILVTFSYNVLQIYIFTGWVGQKEQFLKEDKMEKSEMEKRIDHLEDDRFERMIGQVNELHKILLGNGSEGIIQIVAKNSAKIKIILWALSVMIGAILGSYYKGETRQETTNAIADAIVSNINTNMLLP